MPLQIRRGLEADRLSITPLEGELLYVKDTGKLYVGDGTTAGGGVISSELISELAPLLGGNLDLNGNNIVGNGNININGTITATGNINLGDGSEDNVFVGGQITSSLTPDADGSYDIGSMSLRWRNGYFAGLVVDGQINAVSVNANLIANDSTVVFDANAGTINAELVSGTFTGNVTGNVTGVHFGPVTGDVTGSIFADDSTLLIDAINREFFGNLTGNVAGNLTGNVSGNVTGDLIGDVTGTVVGDVTGSVFADDSTLLVDAINQEIFGTFRGTVTGANNVDIIDTATNTVRGNFFGDGSGLLDVNIDNRSHVISVRGTDGTVIIDRSTNKIDGTFIGLATGIVQAPVIGSDSSTIIDINSNTVNGNFVGNLQGNVQGNVTGNVTGVHFGPVTGDVTGSIFANDSTLLIDGITGVVVSPIVDTDRLISNVADVEDETDPQVNIGRISAGDLSGYTGRIGDVQFRTKGSDGTKTYGIITGYTQGIIISHNDNGVDFPADTLNTITKTGVALGGISPQARLDVRGDAIVSGTIDAASFKGSLVADDSTILIDAINGSLVTANIDIVGTTGTPSVGAGDLANVNEWLQVTVNGNTRYIPLYA